MTPTIGIEILTGPDYTRDEDGWEHHAYTLRLTYDGRTMDTPWKQGLGNTDDPDAATVMESLALDAAGYDNAWYFEDWAREYGYDPDSRKAERLYNAVSEQVEKLRVLLGDDYSKILNAAANA